MSKNLPTAGALPPVLRLSDLKTRHALLLVNTLRKHASLSRVELAKAMSCDNTTVTRTVRDLLSRGLLRPVGKTEREHGRPREQLSLNPSGGGVIGIALTPTHITGALMDLAGNIRLREQIYFPQERTRTLFLEALSQVTERLVAAGRDNLLGMGVSTFGTSLDGGMSLNVTANFPELQHLDLNAFFKEKFGLSPHFADMMVCLMQHELDRAPELSQGTTLLVSAGSGIGMAVAVDGKPLSGARHHGGELGHNILEPNGLQCKCGRRGCLETRASADILLAQARRRLKAPALSWEAFAEACRQDRPAARDTVRAAVPYLAIAVANLVNNLAPEHLVFTGELFQTGPWLCAELEAALRKLLFQFTADGLQLIFRTERDDSSVLGAAGLVLDRLFDTPELFEKICPPRL